MDLEDRSTQLVAKSSPIPDNVELDQNLPTAPDAAETPVPGVQPSTAVRTDVQSRKAVTDRQDKPGPEAESRSEEVNAETGEVTHKESTDCKFQFQISDV